MKKITTVLACLVALGCQEEEKHKAKVPSSLFAADDLVPGSVSEIDADEVEYAINDSSVAEAGGSTDQPGFSLQSDDECVDGVFDTLTADADEANLTVRGTLDFKSCFQDNPEFSITKAEANVLLYVGCDDGKLKQYNGWKAGDLENADGGCRESEATKYISNVDISIEGVEYHTDRDGNPMTAELGLRMLQTTQSDGGHCEAKFGGGNISWSNACFAVERSYFTKLLINGQATDLSNNEDYLKAQYENIVEKDATGFQWYESGKFLVQLNNWKGEVVFNGAQTAPAWTLSDGSSTASGTMGTAAGLNLKEKARSKISRIFK